MFRFLSSACDFCRITTVFVTYISILKTRQLTIGHNLHNNHRFLYRFHHSSSIPKAIVTTMRTVEGGINTTRCLRLIAKFSNAIGIHKGFELGAKQALVFCEWLTRTWNKVCKSNWVLRVLFVRFASLWWRHIPPWEISNQICLFLLTTQKNAFCKLSLPCAVERFWITFELRSNG